MIDPTRKEWLEARRQLQHCTRFAYSLPGPSADLNMLTEAILGPCPPEPAPEPFRSGMTAAVITARARRAAGLCIANPRPVGCKLIATDGFCGYCQRLIDGEPATIARRRARRASDEEEVGR